MIGVIINPGTEPVENSDVENAIESVGRLIVDSCQEDVTAGRAPSRDDGGRYGFVLKKEGSDKEIDIDMPGCDPDLMQRGEPLVSPRLYVDGSSWLWQYAIGFVNFDKPLQTERSGVCDRSLLNC